MPSDPKVIYWDTCIFLAWLKGENRPEGEMADLMNVVREIDKKNFHLVTSVITKAEILFNRSGEGVATKFNDLFKRSNIKMINVDERIATKASEIREYYIEKSIREGKPSLGFADVLHLATAVTLNAFAFHTFDGGNRKRGLLELSGDVAGFPLTIEKPHAGQRELDFSKKSSRE